MITLSTHVLDADAGQALVGVRVTVTDQVGEVVGSGATGPDGRIAELASGLVPGSYRIDWEAGGRFLRAVAATVELVADRHYHVPLLASRSSAVVYLGV